MEQIKHWIQEGRARIVDVRTPREFARGHISGSINIPLNELHLRLGEIRDLENLVLCCASGTRSAQAYLYLISQGIECHDAGSWMTLDDCGSA